MKISRIKISNFRGTEEREIHIGPGVTVVEGPNEAGKSSLAEAVQLILEVADSSKSRRVKDIVPVHRDAAPEIELAFETGEYELVYRKRFMKKPKTELEILQPRAENVTGKTAHDRVLKILEETLDTALWRALQIEQGKGIDQAHLADSRALETALDAAAGGSGDDLDHGPLLGRVMEEFSRYFTPTGRSKSLVSEAGELVASLQEREAELEDELEALRRDVDESARLASRLRRVEMLIPDLETAVQERDSELRRVETFELQVESAANDLRAANLHLESAQKSKRERDRLLKDLAQAEEELGDLELQLDEAAEKDELERVKGAEDDLSAARLARASAETDEERSAQDLGHLRRTSELGDLEGRQASVAKLRATGEQAREQLAGNTVTDDVLERFQEAQLAVGQAQAALEAGGPELEVRALRDLQIVVNGDAVEIASGGTDRRPVIEETTLAIPGQLELVLTPGSSLEELEAAAESAASTWAELCEAHSVDSVKKASAAHVARANAERVLDGSEGQIAQALGDSTAAEIEARITSLADKLAAYERERQPEPPRPESESVARENHKEARGALLDARGSFGQAEQALAVARKHQEAVSSKHLRAIVRSESVQGRQAGLVAELDTARKIRSDEDLQCDVDAALGTVDGHTRNVFELKRELEKQNPAQGTALLQSATAAVEQARTEQKETEVDLAAVRARLEVKHERGVFEELEDTRAKLHQAQQSEASLRRRADAVKLLHDLLLRHKARAHGAYVAPLAARINGLGRLVYGSTFKVGLSETLQIESRTLGGRTIPFDSLSKGTQEQLGLLARLAAALTVTKAGTAHGIDDGVPLILDDALGHTDPDRLASMASTIASAAAGCQVIILTCTPDRFRGIPSAKFDRLSAQ